MKNFVMTVVALLCALSFAGAANAELSDRGGGLIYDDLLDITWLQYANYSGQTLTWDAAADWAAALVYQGYEDWRLPDSDASCSGSDCIDSEMGHLFYTEGMTADSPGLFIDVRPYMYWSGTEDNSDPARAFRFNFSSGSQGTSAKTLGRYAWAVRDGDSAAPVVPEPVSSTLFVIGGLTMGARRCFGRQEN